MLENVFVPEEGQEIKVTLPEVTEEVAVVQAPVIEEVNVQVPVEEEIKLEPFTQNEVETVYTESQVQEEVFEEPEPTWEDEEVNQVNEEPVQTIDDFDFGEDYLVNEREPKIEEVQETVVENQPIMDEPVFAEIEEVKPEFEFESVVNEPVYKDTPIIPLEYKDEEKESLKLHITWLTQELEDKENKIIELENQREIAMEDVSNLRFRLENEIEDLKKYGNTKLLKDILPSLDTLGTIIRNSGSFSNEVKAYVDGFAMIYNQILSALKQNEVTEIEVHRGDNFDSAIHEAIDTVFVTKENEANRIYKIVNNGYKLNDRLIKPVRVVVTVLK